VANKKTLETAEPFQFSPAEPVDYGKDVQVKFGCVRLSETAKRSGPEPVPNEAEGSGFRD